MSSAQAFGMCQKLWAENIRTRQLDQQTGKEFLRFAYVNPKKYSVWLQRDQGRPDLFELILRWEDDQRHEVYIISQPAPNPVGNDARAAALLNNMLITPSVMFTPNSNMGK